jgi:AbrB family looped-hinge helix DNA binding protein
MNVRLSQKGWVVIPASLRAKYGLKAGAILKVVDYGGVLAIVPRLKNPIDDGAGMLQGGKSLTQALLDERGEERKRESR